MASLVEFDSAAVTLWKSLQAWIKFTFKRCTVYMYFQKVEKIDKNLKFHFNLKKAFKALFLL